MATLNPSYHSAPTYAEPRDYAPAWYLGLLQLLPNLGRRAKQHDTLHHMSSYRARDIGMQSYVDNTLTEYPSQRAYDRLW